MSANTSTLQRKSPMKLHRPRGVQRNYTENEVQERIDSAISSGNRIPEVVGSLLNECAADGAEAQQRTIFERCIDALNNDRLQTLVAKDIVGKLLFKVENLQGATLVALAELLIKGVKEGYHQALELFPKFLSVISSLKIIHYKKEDGSMGEMGGPTQKSLLLNSLCGCRWDSGCVQRIAHMCQEIPMSSDELEFLIQKILRVMQTMKVSELPPLVYQLLVLSVKGHRAIMLEGIKILFSQLDQEVMEANQEEEEDSVVTMRSSVTELLQTEGTVILHITCALKQDPELRKEFLKSLKASQLRLTTSSLSLFHLALILSLARIHIFEDAVFSFIKEMVLKSYKEQEGRKASKWMQEVYQDAPDLEKMLLDTVDHSLNGWDHVVQGLFIAGLHLMENFVPKSATSILSGPQYKACCLGRKLLYHTFKVHAMVRQELVSQLVNRILTNASTYAGHYIGLLSSLVKNYHQAALDSLPKLKEAFSSLSLLPPRPALELLHAILPLVQYNISLRDSLLLVLRKSLFCRQMEARKIAVGAYVMLLKKFTVLDALNLGSEDSQSSVSSSQVMVEVHAAGSSSTPSNNGALCLEILGVLRRALTKQCDVRLSLYEGLCTVSSTNFKLAEPIVDLLLGQFEQYYEPERDALPPLKLSACFSIGDGEATLLEPLDVLVQSLQLCVCKYLEWQEKIEEDREGDQSIVTPDVVESAHEVLQSLVDRMIKSEPEDFELDKSSIFTQGSSVGLKNRLLAQLVMGVYETLLEFTFSTGEFSQTSIEQTLKLYQGYKRIADILQERGGAQGGGAGGKKGGGSSVAIKSRLTLQCIPKLLRALFSDLAPNHQQSLKILRDSPIFTKYVVSIAIQKIHQIHERGTCESGFADFRPDKIFKLCCQMARFLYKHTETAASHIPAAKKDKGKPVSVLCLEGFSELLQTVVTRYHAHPEPESSSSSHRTSSATSLESFLATINPSIDASTCLDERIHYFIRQLQRLIVGTSEGNIKEWTSKEIVLLINMVRVLAGELDGDSSELSEVFDWVNTQCKQQQISDIQVTKVFVSLLLFLNARFKVSVKTLVKLAQDIHYHLGDIDEDIELESSPNYAIVSRQTAPTGVLNQLYTHIDLVMVDADWLITQLKAELVNSPVEEIFERERSSVCTQAKDYCSFLCSRLTDVVSGLTELVQTLVAAGSNTEGLLKTLTKFFTTLSNLTKYCLAAFQQTSCIIPNFKKLVNEVGSELCQLVYSFLTYIQTSQPQPGGEHAERRSKKGKGGKGKAKGKGGPVGGGKHALIRKETRSFPSLIFAIEQFEKQLILLGKKSKENLMEAFKRSMARDFRIDMQTVETVLNEEGGEEEEEEEVDNGAGESEGEDPDEHPPPSKRHKTH